MGIHNLSPAYLEALRDAIETAYPHASTDCEECKEKRAALKKLEAAFW